MALVLGSVSSLVAFWLFLCFLAVVRWAALLFLSSLHDAPALYQVQMKEPPWAETGSHKSYLLSVAHACCRDGRWSTQMTYIPVFLFFFRQSLTQCWVNHTQFLIDSPMLPLMRFPWASKLLPTIGPESYKGRSSWHETQSMLPAVLFLCLQNWFRATPEAAKSCVFLESFTFC